MTEEEWFSCADPARLLAVLPGRGYDRKLRLAACALWRRYEYLLTPQRLEAITVAERFADQLAGPTELARQRIRGTGVAAGTGQTAVATAYGRVIEQLFQWWMQTSAGEQAGSAWERLRRQAVDEVTPLVCALIRDVVGSPFRTSSTLESWLPGVAGDVRLVAEGIYAEGAFDRLDILADALLDANCVSGPLLEHCRSAGLHVRGCWAVDLCLSRS